MHATTSAIRSSIAIILLVGLGLASGCSTPVEWERVEVIPQRLTIEFPGPDEGEELSETLPGTDFTMQGLGREIGDDYFAATTIHLPPGTPFDIDGGVDGAVENALANLESQIGEQGEAEIVERDTAPFGEIESRRFIAVLSAGDVVADYHSRILLVDDQLVQIVVIDQNSDDTDDATRFLDSLADS